MDAQQCRAAMMMMLYVFYWMRLVLVISYSVNQRCCGRGDT
jgi:hypothetical protein